MKLESLKIFGLVISVLDATAVLCLPIAAGSARQLLFGLSAAMLVIMIACTRIDNA